MPKFYYISFKYESDKLKIKEFTDIKPLRDPHFAFDLCEIEFMLSGQWDMWVKMTLEGDRLVKVEKEVNCNVALDDKYPELYILLNDHYSPAQPDNTILPVIYDLERQYWELREN